MPLQHLLLTLLTKVIEHFLNWRLPCHLDKEPHCFLFSENSRNHFDTMAAFWSLSSDEGYWSSNDERPLPIAKRQKTDHATNVPQTSNSDLEIAELCFLMARVTLEEPPLPPPILIVTDDMDTPTLIERRLARARRIGSDANIEEINRYAPDHEGEKHPHVWPRLLYPLWNSRMAVRYGFKEPDYDHPFLNRVKIRPGKFYKQL